MNLRVCLFCKGMLLFAVFFINARTVSGALKVNGCSESSTCVLHVEEKGHLICQLENVENNVNLEFTVDEEYSSSIVFHNQHSKTITTNGSFKVVAKTEFTMAENHPNKIFVACKTVGAKVGVDKLIQRVELLRTGKGLTCKTTCFLVFGGLAGISFVAWFYWPKLSLYIGRGYRTNGSKNEKKTIPDAESQSQDQNPYNERQELQFWEAELTQGTKKFSANISDITQSILTFSEILESLYGNMRMNYGTSVGDDFNELRDETRDYATNYARDVFPVMSNFFQSTEDIFKTFRYVDFEFWSANILDFQRQVDECHKKIAEIVRINSGAVLQLEQMGQKATQILTGLATAETPSTNSDLKKTYKSISSYVQKLIKSVRALIGKFQMLESYLSLLKSSYCVRCKQNTSEREILFEVFKHNATSIKENCSEFKKQVPRVVSNILATFKIC